MKNELVELRMKNMKKDDVPECWLKREQLDVLEALCKTYDTNLKQVMIEQTLNWARRMTDGYADLNRDMRKKLGKEWDY